jgi:hypothetical protein
MSRDPAQRRDALTTKVTIIQLQAELLRRQLRRRDGLTEADRRWLETALAPITQAAREIVPLLLEDDGLEQAQRVRSMPMQRPTAFDLPSRKNERAAHVMGHRSSS